MVAAVIRVGELALAIDGAAKLASPNDERFVQETALLQILEKTERISAEEAAMLKNDIRERAIGDRWFREPSMTKDELTLRGYEDVHKYLFETNDAAKA